VCENKEMNIREKKPLFSWLVVVLYVIPSGAPSFIDRPKNRTQELFVAYAWNNTALK
jgi:hypothetical protein